MLAYDNEKNQYVAIKFIPRGPQVGVRGAAIRACREHATIWQPVAGATV